MHRVKGSYKKLVNLVQAPNHLLANSQNQQGFKYKQDPYKLHDFSQPYSHSYRTL